MSLIAGAGAGSSCPDVVVERRLRVPTLFWSIKIIWSARPAGPAAARGAGARTALDLTTPPASCVECMRAVVRVHAVVCPPAGP